MKTLKKKPAFDYTLQRFQDLFREISEHLYRQREMDPARFHRIQVQLMEHVER